MPKSNPIASSTPPPHPCLRSNSARRPKLERPRGQGYPNYLSQLTLRKSPLTMGAHECVADAAGNSDSPVGDARRLLRM